MGQNHNRYYKYQRYQQVGLQHVEDEFSAVHGSVETEEIFQKILLLLLLPVIVFYYIAGCGGGNIR